MENLTIFFLHAAPGVIAAMFAVGTVLILSGTRRQRVVSPEDAARELELLTRRSFVPRIYLAQHPRPLGTQEQKEHET